MTKKRDIGTARATDTIGVFKGHEADWFFQRSLAYMNGEYENSRDYSKVEA